MELILGLYLAIGFIVGLERLSRVDAEDSTPMVCIGIAAIIALWPIYVLYSIVKSIL